MTGMRLRAATEASSGCMLAAWSAGTAAAGGLPQVQALLHRSAAAHLACSAACLPALTPRPLQAALALDSAGSGLPPPHEFTFFCEPRHDEAPPAPPAGDQQGAAAPAGQQQQQQQHGGGSSGLGEGLVSKWRQKERLKTTAVALVMCLNIGVCLCWVWWPREQRGAAAVHVRVPCLWLGATQGPPCPRGSALPGPSAHPDSVPVRVPLPLGLPHLPRPLLRPGVDPPDVIKISPCARLECWVDPLSMQAPKALDTIGGWAHGRATGAGTEGGWRAGRDGREAERGWAPPLCSRSSPCALPRLCLHLHASTRPSTRPHPSLLRPPLPSGKNLQAQYERWQPRAKYKMHLDPTTEDVKKLAISCRRTAKVGCAACMHVCVRACVCAGGGGMPAAVVGRACQPWRRPPALHPRPAHARHPRRASAFCSTTTATACRAPRPTARCAGCWAAARPPAMPPARSAAQNPSPPTFPPLTTQQVWVFNNSYTQYIPLSIYDLQVRA